MKRNSQMIAASVNANVRANGMVRVAVAHRSIQAQHRLDGKRLAYPLDPTTKPGDGGTWCCPSAASQPSSTDLEQPQRMFQPGQLPASAWARFILSQSLCS